MSVLFDGVSRKRRMLTLLIFIAITFALLSTPGSTRGLEQDACCTDFTLVSSVVTDFASIDCATAETRAYRKAIDSVQLQASAWVCPSLYPSLKEVTAPHITYWPECTSLVLFTGVTRWNKAAGAEGTYRCMAILALSK